MTLKEIFTFDNLYKSHKKCRLNKQHKGEVIRFEINLAHSLSKLVREFGTEKFKFSKYKEFKIYDPKERCVEAPTYKDRVVMMCFSKVSIRPKLDKRLVFDNAACRLSKGTHFARSRLEKFLRAEFCRGKNNDFYYLKCDIAKYFQNINHEILLNKLAGIGFSEEEMMFLRKLIVEQDKFVARGLPLGNQTSQWFAILYLDRIDRLIKEELHIKGYVRYMDDFILIHRDKKYLQYCMAKIAEVADSELKLELNHKTQIGKVRNGIDFLGFRHYLTETGKVETKLRSSAKARMKRKLKVLGILEKKKMVDSEYVKLRKEAFYNHVKNSDESDNFKLKLIAKNKKISAIYL